MSTLYTFFDERSIRVCLAFRSRVHESEIAYWPYASTWLSTDLRSYCVSRDTRPVGEVLIRGRRWISAADGEMKVSYFTHTFSLSYVPG